MSAVLQQQPATTLEEQARERLREDILAGAVQPGARLRIRELSLRYGVGASPLREALSRLVSEELVVLEGNKGFRAAPLSLKELGEVTEMRALLEGHALKQSMQRGGDEWEGRVVSALHKLRLALSTPLRDDAAQRVRWEDAHYSFHAALASECGSSYLLRSIAKLYQVLVRYRAWLQFNELPPADLAAIHDELAEVALKRKAGMAETRLAEHVQVNMVQVEENLRLHPELLSGPA